MSKSIRGVRKYTRQQRPPEPGEPITVRLHRGALGLLDTWRAKQDDAPSRPEAIRRLIERALATEPQTEGKHDMAKSTKPHRTKSGAASVQKTSVPPAKTGKTPIKPKTGKY